jgi:hypothetical protein
MQKFFEGFEKAAGWRDAIAKGTRKWVSDSGRIGQAVHKGGTAVEAGLGAAAGKLKGTKAEGLLNRGKDVVNKGRKEYTKALKHNAQTAREGGKYLTNDAGKAIDKGKDFIKKTVKRYRDAGLS